MLNRDKDKLKAILTEIDTLPSRLIYKKEPYVRAKDRSSMMNYLPPYLAECACGDMFDRRKSTIRKGIEDRIIEEIEKRFPIDKVRELNYLSMGSGYLLPDYVICARLIEKGYSLRVILIDPECGPNDKGEKDTVQQGFQNALSQFMTLEAVARDAGLTFNVTSYSNILDYIKTQPGNNIHVAHAIDFGVFTTKLELNSYDDLFLVHQLLVKDGFFHFSISDQEYFYNQSDVFHRHDHQLDKWDLGIDKQLFHEQARLLPSISKKASEVETEASVTSLPPGIVKNIMQFTGIFRQGPLFEKLALLESAGITLKTNAL